MWLSFFNLKKKQILANLESLKEEDLIPTDIFTMLKPFSFFSPNELKVIILGQNPYPSMNHANGLAFDTKNKQLPPTLKNIIKKLLIEYKINYFYEFLSLENWAKQGVLLLNIEPFIVKKRTIDFEVFLKFYQFSFLNKLFKEKKVPIIAWGKKCQIYLESLNEELLLVKGVHPSPLSAYRGFFKQCFFLKVNELLKDNNYKEIDWLKAIKIEKKILK